MLATFAGFALVEETSIRSLVMDGIDIVLERRGEAPVRRWAPRRKQRQDRPAATSHRLLESINHLPYVHHT
jgi:hypothetical protein